MIKKEEKNTRGRKTVTKDEKKYEKRPKNKTQYIKKKQNVQYRNIKEKECKKVCKKEIKT